MSFASASTFRHRRTPSTTSAPSIPVCCKASSPRATTDWSRRSTSPSALRRTPLRTAKPKLERIETDILNNFKTLGVRTEPLSGYERLKVLHDVFNMDTNEPFRFSFDMVARTGLSTKDFIAPTSFDFREGKCFKMGKTIGAVSFLQILAPELNDRMLADFLEMDSNITVNFHIRTIDQAKAIKSIKIEDHRPRQDED